MYERFRAEKIKALSMAENAVCPLSFYIFRGEVLGVLGMDGMERNSLIRILSGQEKMLQGRMWIRWRRDKNLFGIRWTKKGNLPDKSGKPSVSPAQYRREFYPDVQKGGPSAGQLAESPAAPVVSVRGIRAFPGS